MQTPSEHEKKQQDERSRFDSESSSSVPDLLGPSPAMMSPMDLVGRAIQGFCTPLEHLHQRHQQHQRAASSGSLAHGAGTAGADDNLSPRSCRPPASNLLNAFAVDASSSVSSKDHAEDEEEEQDDGDDDDDDLWLVETGPGTGRAVRVLRALEIFLGTVALLLLTLSAAQRLGVQLEWHPKSATDNQAAFVSLKQQQQAPSHHGAFHKVIPPEETPTTDDAEFCADGHVPLTTKTGGSNASMTCSDTLLDAR